MSNDELLKELTKRLAKKTNTTFDEIDFCKKHNMRMEEIALQYRMAAFGDVRTIIRDIEHEIKNNE